MWAGRMAALMSILAVFGAAAAPARAQVQLPAKPQIASLDSDAPAGSPPHWLPGEQWVMQHWLPYDEQRLYSLLGVDRGVIWRQLRDDTRTLAQLAQERGWEPQALARELVAPWRGQLRDPARLALLEKRALRTLTQGHLSQHLFFHSLHQEAIPTHATAIFGVASRAEWSTLRRSELSPLQICRLNGLPRGHAQEQAAATLREYAEKGVARQAIPAVQAERLLSRQLRQLPRWLQQTRYNGPPPLVSPALLAGHRVELLQQRGALGRRPRGRVRELPGQARDRQAAGRDRGDGARRRRRDAAGAGERGDGGPALELQPGAVGQRALGRVRVGARQPQLRQALRAHGGPRPRPAQRAHDPGQPPAGAGVLALGLQPDDLGRRPADRL